MRKNAQFMERKYIKPLIIRWNHDYSCFIKLYEYQQPVQQPNPPQSGDNAAAFDKKNNKEKMKPASCSQGWKDSNNRALI